MNNKISPIVGVVGGSGFIGTRLCRSLLDAGIDFRIIDKRVSSDFPENATLADVTNLVELTAALNGCDAIINLAAEHRDDVRPPDLYYSVNVGGAENVCAAAEILGIRTIVFTSTVAVYGFAPVNTGEDGVISPFNEYGRTKAQAEGVYIDWQHKSSEARTLVIVRPTVVFGERNRGNVYNLLRQIASGIFVMLGDGRNRKSMAYVGNVAAFLLHMLASKPGVHTCNYIDKPDLDMNELVFIARSALGRRGLRGARLPYAVGYVVGGVFDFIAYLTNKTFPISRIRVRKFCATTQFSSAAESFGFFAPYTLREGLEKTLKFEFLNDNEKGELFYTE